MPYKLSEDGIEIQACNATGHFAFTLHLLPILKSTAEMPGARVRILNVASDAHETASNFDFTSLEGLNTTKSSPFGRYANSKLMVCLHSGSLRLPLTFSLEHPLQR